jgi:hypothetical protein
MAKHSVYTPAKGERVAINKGRAEFKRGEYVTLAKLHDELETGRRQKRSKGTGKSSRQRSASR